MKYLNKFNESSEQLQPTFDDLKDIFVEIFHETDFRVTYKPTLGTFNVVIEMPQFITSGNPYTGTTEVNIDELLKRNEKLRELYLDIDMSIKRMMEYFPETEYKIVHNKIGTIYIKIK